MVNFIRQNLLTDTESGGRLLADNGAICWKTLLLLANNGAICSKTLSLLAILLQGTAPLILFICTG